MDRRPGSGRPQMTTLEGNKEMIEDLISFEEENSVTHISQTEREKYPNIILLPLRSMVKRKGLKQFKYLKTPQMNEGTKKEGQKEKATQLKNSGETPEALKNMLDKMKKV